MNSSKQAYIAKIPLVLTDDAGRTYRISAGDKVELTETQFKDVSAYVIPNHVNDSGENEDQKKKSNSTKSDEVKKVK